MQQLQALPNNVFLQPEFATTALPITLTAGSIALQNTGSGTVAGCNTALITFASAHGYTATQQANGTTLIQNPTTNHVPTPYGGVTLDSAYLLFQIAGATGNTAINGFTMAVLAIPSTTTMLVTCPVTGANPTITAATFVPAFALQYGQYNLSLGPNCAANYNPDNTGSPYINVQSSVVPAPTFRVVQAVSTAGQIEFEGAAGQTIILASGGAGTSRWSLYFR
jgi:hypothetical protein